MGTAQDPPLLQQQKHRRLDKPVQVSPGACARMRSPVPVAYAAGQRPAPRIPGMFLISVYYTYVAVFEPQKAPQGALRASGRHCRRAPPNRRRRRPSAFDTARSKISSMIVDRLPNAGGRLRSSFRRRRAPAELLALPFRQAFTRTPNPSARQSHHVPGRRQDTGVHMAGCEARQHPRIPSAIARTDRRELVQRADLCDALSHFAETAGASTKRLPRQRSTRRLVSALRPSRSGLPSRLLGVACTATTVLIRSRVWSERRTSFLRYEVK
jgi:hypothetical protein